MLTPTILLGPFSRGLVPYRSRRVPFSFDHPVLCRRRSFCFLGAVIFYLTEDKNERDAGRLRREDQGSLRADQERYPEDAGRVFRAAQPGDRGEGLCQVGVRSDDRLLQAEG